MDLLRPPNNVTEFAFLGLMQNPHLQKILFIVFLFIFLFTVLAILLIVITISLSPTLSAHIYFFLIYLALTDAFHTSAVTPKMIIPLLYQKRITSWSDSLNQIFLAHFLGGSDIIVLTVMAYDRYVGIYKPLHYTTIMSQKLCSLLVGASYSWGTVCSLTLTHFLSELSFRGNNIINNFVCEQAAFVDVSCSDPYISQEIILVSAMFNEISSLMIILTSYIFIFITVLNMPSTGGHHKPFSTCASHLTAITIFHGTILFLYCVPDSRSSWLMVKVASFFYTVVIPMLNPVIYSLRNKEVKETARKLVNTKLLCQ
ncbi:olfactory receptor 5D13-like [Bos javanicus]|uniref:olfactory receptor 5D13-like n=1 Tax=Bos javanicus TaxID=9906 RepID=UPI002AA86F12|nr:olfactory receptor 5D13-like [Bos javanicus]